MLPLGSLVVSTRSLPSESGYYWHGKLLLSRVVTIATSESVSAPKNYRQAIAYVLSSPWRH